MRILLFKIKQWWSNAKKEYEDSQVQEVQEANNSDLKEWYTYNWEVREMSGEKVSERYKKAKEDVNEYLTKNKNKTNKKTKKSTLEDI